MNGHRLETKKLVLLCLKYAVGVMNSPKKVHGCLNGNNKDNTFPAAKGDILFDLSKKG